MVTIEIATRGLNLLLCYGSEEINRIVICFRFRYDGGGGEKMAERERLLRIIRERLEKMSVEKLRRILVVCA